MNEGHVVALVVAAALTLFDLDRTFYLPTKIGKKLELYFWYWGFIALNGFLAVILLIFVVSMGWLKDTNVYLTGLIVGVSFLAIIRTKLTSFELNGQTVPFGLELLYEAAKKFAYKRINKIAKDARRVETLELVKQKSLIELVSEAKLSINQDALSTPAEKEEDKKWLSMVLQEGQSQPLGGDADQRASIADYILSGRRQN